MKQLGELQRALPKFEDRGATLLAASVDPHADTKKLVKKLGLTYPVLADAGRIVDGFGVRSDEIAWPSVFVVRDGRIVWRALAGSYRYDGRPPVATVLAGLEAAKSGTAKTPPKRPSVPAKKTKTAK